MTLDDILASLFPGGHDVRNDCGTVFGSGALRSGGRALVIGVADRTAVGVDGAIPNTSWLRSKAAAARYLSSWTATANG